MLEKIQSIATRLDKKRVYTAVGALVVALAAGHVMQRTVSQPSIAVDMPSKQSLVPGAPLPTSVTPAASIVPETDSAPLAEPDMPEPVMADAQGADTPALDLPGSDAQPSDAAMAPDLATDIALADPVAADAEMDVAPEVTKTDDSPALAPVLAPPSSDAALAEANADPAPAVIAVPVDDIAAVLSPEALEMVDIPAALPASDAQPEPVAVAEDAALTAPVEPDTDTAASDEVAPIEVAEVSRAAVDGSLPMPAIDDPVFDSDPAAIVPAPNPLATSGECAPALTLAPMPGAMIYIDYIAPCDPNAEVEFDHAGLRFSEKLDDQGSLTMMVPALTADASITAHNPARVDTRSADVMIPDMAAYDRVALVWQGGTGLQLHALENGAYYGEEGHIWAETPGVPDRATNGIGGFVTVLGTVAGGFAADVYSYPVSMPAAPSISIEAQVLDTTCGSAISGAYLRSVPAGKPVETMVGMIVPDCETVGEYLVLKNLPQNLTIARN